MISTLRRFLRFDFHHPKADLWNELVDEVGRRMPRLLNVRTDARGAFPHPFQVTVERWSELPAKAKMSENRAWKVSIRAGFVNDEPVTIGYRRKDDLRGWVMPDDYPALKPGDTGYHPDFVERPLYETEDPPFLALEAPSLAKTEQPRQWQLLTFEDRLDFFRTEEMMEKEVYRASLVVTASPRVAGIFFPELPTKLLRFRAFVGKRPNRSIAGAGGFVEVAQVFLLRDREHPDTEADEVVVKQLVFWCLGNVVVQSGVPLPGAGTFGDGLLTDLAQAELDRLTAENATVEFWSQ